MPVIQKIKAKLNAALEQGSRSGLTLANVLFGALLMTYGFFFWRSIAPYWFNPRITTDDAVQQLYPFYKALDPEIFRGDIITTMMEHYLPPLHYALGFFLTRLTGDPIMTGHYIMLVQLFLTLLFVFLAVRNKASLAAAFFAVTWLLHTRPVIQRLTCGLPRGWGAVVLSAGLYFLLAESELGILVLLLLGCMLHPPATLTIAIAYGIFLLWGCMGKERRPQNFRKLVHYTIFSPILFVTVLYVVQARPEIGSMADYETAAGMPEFSYPKGRFPFVPLQDVGHDLEIFAFQPFIGHLYKPARWVRHNMPYVAACLIPLVALIGWKRGKIRAFPAQTVIYLFACAAVYVASRELAFKLYVPNRHLQIPLALFFTVGLTVAVWRAFYARGPKNALVEVPPDYSDTSLRHSAGSVVALMALSCLVYIGSGTGLKGDLNFNYRTNARGAVFKWLRENSPKDALIAGEPTFVDPTQLFARRKVFISTEAAHPFYDGYYAAVKPRIEVVLKALYAPTLSELVNILEPHNVDYFIFAKAKFYPQALAAATYFKPFDMLVQGLVARDAAAARKFAYFSLPPKPDLQKYPFMPFRDNKAALVDIKALKEWLKEHGEEEGGATSEPAAPEPDEKEILDDRTDINRAELDSGA